MISKTADKSVEITQTEARGGGGGSEKLKGTKNTGTIKQYQRSNKCVTGNSTEEKKQRIRDI